MAEYAHVPKLGPVILILLADLSNTEMAAAAMFYQFTLYSAIRLAHHGFTLGELGLVSFGATSLFMEVMNLTMARVCQSTDRAMFLLMSTAL